MSNWSSLGMLTGVIITGIWIFAAIYVSDRAPRDREMQVFYVVLMGGLLLTILVIGAIMFIIHLVQGGGA